jgi:hypothetical protein
MQKPNMREMVSENKHSQIFSWIKYNLTGWSIGILCGFFIALFLLTPFEPLLNPFTKSIFAGIFFWSPFGLSIGITQQLRLKKWKFQANDWVLATTIGWFFSGTAFSFTYDYFARQNNHADVRMIVITAILVMLTGGLIIGGFQSIAIRKALSRIDVWILANALGMLFLGLIVLGTFFSLTPIFLKFFFADGSFILSLVSSLISMLFFGVFTLHIPTGIILLKYGNSSMSKAG